MGVLEEWVGSGLEVCDGGKVGERGGNGGRLDFGSYENWRMGF